MAAKKLVNLLALLIQLLNRENRSHESSRQVVELEESFDKAVNQLPPEQRTAILLVQQDMPYEEIAIAMKAPVSSVKTWIHRARTRLRELLKDYYDNHQKLQPLDFFRGLFNAETMRPNSQSSFDTDLDSHLASLSLRVCIPI
jgi:23S rRNA A2030 N6-methylase RlmJ